MWRKVSLVLFFWAVRGLYAQEGNWSADPTPGKMLLTEGERLVTLKPENSVTIPAKVEESQPGGAHLLQSKEAPTVGAEETVHGPTTEPLEDEMDNQENIISQLLGDYDKVKTVSSGSDCVCRCIVKPIKRADCSRIHESEPTAPSQEFYSVETVTRGTDCKKCVCMAPSSAVNPCEGEYRFKKLQEASKDDIKLATIIDLLEGSMYGMDLLKLQSVTTRLLNRMDSMEKAFTRNLTERAREKERAKDKMKEKDRDKKAQQKKKKMNDLERAGVKSGAAAYAHKQKNNESQLKKNQQQDGVEQPMGNKTAAQNPMKEKTESRVGLKEKNGMVIRGVTFYKAEEESYKEDEEEKKGRGRNATLTPKASVDLLISDQVPLLDKTTQRPIPPTTTAQTKILPTTTAPTKPPPTTVKPTTQAAPTTTPQPPTTTRLAITSLKTTTTTTTTVQTTTPASQRSSLPSDTNIGLPTGATLTTKPPQRPRSRLSWTESPADNSKTTKKPGVCKDTVASISEPTQQNSYGLSDGAWMRDARGHGSVIYLTDGHYSNDLTEFRDLTTFKSGQASNTYKLPYSYTGTGHVVFNGAFYYNRAFSRDIIRYDLRHRLVTAWTTLHDALLEEETHRTKTEVEFSVDESGLWLLYPALDTEGFHTEVMLLLQLHPRDLQTVRTFRTGLRRNLHSNSFLVCGVLYGVNSMEQRYANVTYAFDTHTLTHTVPSLALTNTHGHTSQLSYCPLDKKLYAWDNGHQMTYDVIFAY